MNKRELYGVQQSMRHFNTEIEGRRVTIFTDHKPLIGAFKSPNSMAHDSIALNQILVPVVQREVSLK